MPEQINAGGPNGPGPIGPPRPPAGPAGPGAPGEVGGKSFGDFLSEKIGQVNELQQNADQAIEDLATGKEQDLTKVVGAVEKANLAFQMMVQIRNRLVEAYQEMMRIRT